MERKKKKKKKRRTRTPQGKKKTKPNHTNTKLRLEALLRRVWPSGNLANWSSMVATLIRGSSNFIFIVWISSTCFKSLVVGLGSWGMGSELIICGVSGDGREAPGSFITNFFCRGFLNGSWPWQIRFIFGCNLRTNNRNSPSTKHLILFDEHASQALLSFGFLLDAVGGHMHGIRLVWQ
jgi:hypothetical protein